MNPKEVVSRDPEVVSGALVFAGTRVSVQALVDYLLRGHPLNEFLDDFPTVERGAGDGIPGDDTGSRGCVCFSMR